MNRRSFASATVAATLFGPLARAASAAPAAPPYDARTLAPVFAGGPWVGDRVAPADLAGRVVLVDVFTFECINCTRVVPNLKRLRARYGASDLAIVGVHAPEVPTYQSSLRYVARNVRAQGLAWPVRLDNDFAVWKAYAVDAWPTQLLFDRRGVLVDRIVGDGEDVTLDRSLARLIARR